MRQRAAAVIVPLVTAIVALSACGDEPGTSTTAATVEPDVPGVVEDEPFPADRCESNRAAGTVTFLTGFDYAAASSIVEVIYADSLGYYDELCLDVELQSSFSTANYPLVAGGQAQFASGGSFSEVVAFAEANDADLVAVTVAGRTPIDALIVKPGTAETVADLAGTTIGVKGKLPSSVEIMLSRAGLVEGTDFETVLLDGFDPTAHMAIDSIVGFPGWKSNEPGRLEREGIEFDLFDPSDDDIPGSFGAIFTSREFLDAHPTAAEDFVRATLRGLAAAIDDPTAAANAAVALVNAGGNPNFLSPEGEVFRWETEAALVSGTTPDGVAPGTPDLDALTAEVAAYGAVGLFGDIETPPIGPRIAESLAAAVTRDGDVIWPGG
jgi:ABC-type nitrate/sulfonate/bicarbonate transport system substrate-binding protein